MNVRELQAERHERFQAAEKLIATARERGKDLGGTDLEQYRTHISRMKEIDNLIARSEQLNGIAGRPVVTMGVTPSNGNRDRPADPHSLCPDVEAFIVKGHISERIQASLTEGSDLVVSVPPYALENFRVYAPQLMPFESAGATVFSGDSFAAAKTKIPFILPNATAPTVYAEGAGPSVAQDAVVKGIELSPAKYAFLTKLSEEADADMPDIGRALLIEGLSRVYTATEGAATAALRTSLTAATATTALGTDNLESLLNLEGAITPTHASPSNVLMLSRASLSRLRNTRDGQDRPIFDPIYKTMLGYRTVLNDALDVTGHHYIVFGNWAAGAFIAYSGFLVLRLLEAYREAGMIGIRFARRSASAFFSDASNGADQPLRMMDLGA